MHANRSRLVAQVRPIPPPQFGFAAGILRVRVQAARWMARGSYAPSAGDEVHLMADAIPPEVVAKLMVMLVPKHLALIQKTRAEHPELVTWDEAHDQPIATLATAAYITGLQNHLVLDEQGEASKKASDLGGMFQ